MKSLKKIPKYASLEVESKFWQEQDSTEYVDWTHAKLARFPNLKPSTKNISFN